MNNQPIGIFDSGVGGLSILLEIKKILPHERFIFLADQAYVPYGKKSKAELIDRVGKIIQFFQDQQVKAVVAACNTATVYTIDEMRQRFDMPIIGTVPVVKTIAEITKTGVAAVFSTPATAQSPYLESLINKFAPGKTIIKVGGSNLEELVEQGQTDTPAVQAVLQEILPALIAEKVDAIALGCTHYPFLRDQIQAVVGPEVKLVDSGGAVARRLNTILVNNNIASSEGGSDRYYTTGDAQKFTEVAEKLTHAKLSNVEHINL